MAVQAELSKPSNIDQFKEWSKIHINLDINPDNERLYKINSNHIKSSFEQSPFFRNLITVTQTENTKFLQKFKTQLMMRNEELKLATKSYESLVDKLFRMNVVWNKDFPKPPKDGWITFNNLYPRINDIVRGKMVCTFADGPHILANALCKSAGDFGVRAHHSDRSLDSGYYSVHCYVHFPIEIVSHESSKSSEQISVQIEIQITSQLQDIIYEITHELYAIKRLNTSTNSNAWKWEFGSKEFKAGFLGHALHLFEGIIVELRNSSVSDTTPE